MCKPFEKSDTSVDDAERYLVENNVFESFGTSILNNWANNSKFSNNTLKPLTVTGENGLTSVAILHEAHPVTARGANLMEGIETLNNLLVGDITNTFIRQFNQCFCGVRKCPWP